MWDGELQCHGKGDGCEGQRECAESGRQGEPRERSDSWRWVHSDSRWHGYVGAGAAAMFVLIFSKDSSGGHSDGVCWGGVFIFLWNLEEDLLLDTSRGQGYIL